MKSNLCFVIFILTLIFQSCSSKEIIYNEHYAYYLGDDSSSVVSEYYKIKYSGSTSHKTKTDTSQAILPEPIKLVKPDYPEYHVGDSTYLMEGKVFVQMLVSKLGKVKQAYILKSSENFFNKACLKAAMQFKFKPALEKGKPVVAWVVVPFYFKLP